jgi:UDP-glucose 4-epimerase
VNILIIGGAGFLGTNLVQRCLAESSAQVTVLDSLDPRFQSEWSPVAEVEERVKFVQGDLRDHELLQSTIQGQNIIFNCAGQTSHPLSMQQPLLDTELNCLCNLLVLEAARRHVPKAAIVFTSSSTIVGRADCDVSDEEHVERPLDIYSANKGVAEKYYQIYHSAYDMKTTCVRLPNLFGPYGKSDSQFGFFNYFISLARAGQPIPVYGEGNQKRNILYVEDATEVLWQVAHEPRVCGSLFLATGDEHPTVLEIAEAIDACFGGGGVKPVAWPDDRRRIEIGSVTLSSTRLRAITGWRPRYNLVSGLQRTREIMDAIPREGPP